VYGKNFKNLLLKNPMSYSKDVEHETSSYGCLLTVELTVQIKALGLKLALRGCGRGQIIVFHYMCVVKT
jgi:hypothetical protein